MAPTDEIAQNGWTAVPIDAGVAISSNTRVDQQHRLLMSDIEFPSGDTVVQRVQQYAQMHLPKHTYNHSMRAYYFGKTSSSMLTGTVTALIIEPQ